MVVVAPADGNPLDWPQEKTHLAEDVNMKKLIFGSLLLGLLTGVCFAQRGGARSMGSMGPNVRMAPNARIGPDMNPLPNARHVGPNVGTPVSNVGVGPHASTVGPNVGPSNNTKTVGPNASTVGPNAKTVGPDAAGVGANAGSADPTAGPGSHARTVEPNATTAPDAGAPPHSR